MKYIILYRTHLKSGGQTAWSIAPPTFLTLLTAADFGRKLFGEFPTETNVQWIAVQVPE